MRRSPPVEFAAQPRREKRSKGGQAREIHARAERHRHRAAGSLVEHPDRKLQPAVEMRRAAGAQHRPRRLLDHPMNENTAPSPGMPWVDDLALVAMLRLMGVPPLACTTRIARMGRSGTSPRSRCTTPVALPARHREHRPETLQLLAIQEGAGPNGRELSQRTRAPRGAGRSVHAVRGTELRALRRLQREQASPSPSPFTPTAAPCRRLRA